jgi:hypothetical protein
MAKSKLTDRRLLGTWRSDGRRTGAEIAARRDIKSANKKRLRSLFGKLILRYTKTRCYATLNGQTQISPYVVAAKDGDSVAVVFADPEVGAVISHIHFEGRSFWISLGPIREYFRRIANPGSP